MKLVEESRLDTLVIEQEWEQDFRRWFNGTARALAPFLQDQFAVPSRTPREDEGVLPILSAGLPPDDGKPRHRIMLDNGEEWLRNTVDELRELQAEIGSAPTPRPAPRTPIATASVKRSRWESWKTALYVLGAVASIIALVLFLALR